MSYLFYYLRYAANNPERNGNVLRHELSNPSRDSTTDLVVGWFSEVQDCLVVWRYILSSVSCRTPQAQEAGAQPSNEISEAKL